MIKHLPMTVYFCALAVLPNLAVGGASISPADLRCEYMKDPAGIDEQQPRLSWRLVPANADAYGQCQTFYQVLVSSGPDTLTRNSGDLWDSGVVSSAETTQVA